MSWHDHAAKKRKKPKTPVVNGAFSQRPIDMLLSPAYAVLSRAAHLVISRLEIEMFKHGGTDNGSLICTHADFKKFGLEAHSIAPAINELEALGFIKVQRGGGGNREHRIPNRFLLTYRHYGERGCVAAPDDWKRIKTVEQARDIAKAARVQKRERKPRFRAEERAAS